MTRSGRARLAVASALARVTEMEPPTVVCDSDRPRVATPEAGRSSRRSVPVPARGSGQSAAVGRPTMIVRTSVALHARWKAGLAGTFNRIEVGYEKPSCFVFSNVVAEPKDLGCVYTFNLLLRSFLRKYWSLTSIRFN
jgi:hypothetical protein